MRRRFFLLLLATTAAVATASSHALTYVLSYETVVGQHLIDAQFEDSNEKARSGFDIFSKLAAQIAEDIIHLSSDSATNKNENEEKQDKHQYCVETVSGGGRCNIDYALRGEATLHVAASYFHSGVEAANAAENVTTTVRIDAVITALRARDVLIESVPLISQHLDCQEGVIWSIFKRKSFGDRIHDNHVLSLEKMLLERHDLDQRRRLVSVETNSSSMEVWQHVQGQVQVQSLYVNGYLQSTTDVFGAAHAEALVHPALISLSRAPEYVIIVSQEPSAILKEVLKHERVKSILLVGVNIDMLALAEVHLPSNNDCSFMGQPGTTCLSQPNVQIVSASASDWLTEAVATNGLVADVILLDVPPRSDDLLSVDFQGMLRSVLSTESVMIVACGSAPKLEYSYDLDARHSFLQFVSRRKTQEDELVYEVAFVYDESLASPMASSFFALFPDDSYTLTRFVRTNIPAIEEDIVKYFHHTTEGPLTVVYDGATHASYVRPSKAWQHWRCNTPPGNRLFECTTFLKSWYNRDTHTYSTEVRRDQIKGRSLIATKAIPKGHFVLPDDSATTLRIDHDQWTALLDFIERFPDAEMYRLVRDFTVAYGYQCDAMTQSGWCVSLASNATFTNHACTEEAANVFYVDAIFADEDDKEVGFSPLQVRYADLLGTLSWASRDIAAGEEIQMDYKTFRTYPEDFHNDLMRKICTAGVGMVAPDDGDVLMGYAVDGRGSTDDEL